MSKVFNHTAHWNLWNWLAENPDKHKEDWPHWSEYDDYVRLNNYCFACLACDLNAEQDRIQEELDDPSDEKTFVKEQFKFCKENCPIFVNPCNDYSGLFSKWAVSAGTEASEYAEQIRDLPIRSDWDGKVI